MEARPPDRPFEGKAAVACFAAALVTAFVFPLGGPGIGVFLGGLSVAGAFYLAREPLSREEWGYGLVGLALLAFTFLRAADWLIALLILGALAMATLVAAGGHRWRDFFVSPLRLLLTIEHMPRFFVSPFRQLRATPGARWGPVLRGTVLALVLVFVFGIIFASADQAFALLTDEFFGILDLDLGSFPIRTFIFIATGLATAALVLASKADEKSYSDPPGWVGGSARSSGLEWRIGIAALDAVFVIFVAIQFTVLFGGRTHLLETAGLTYSEYARSGFFQLLVVSLLTLGVIALAIRFSPSDSPHDRAWLRTLLGLLCALTLVVLASAHLRLGLYEQAYGFTRARVFADGVIALVAAIFVAVMLAGWVWKGAWLPRAVAALVALSLIGFAFLNPDQIIASENVARFHETGKVDLHYLSTLSPDAAPALLSLPRGLRDCVIQPTTTRLAQGESWNEWNLARDRARRLIARQKVLVDHHFCAQATRDDYQSEF